MSKLQEELERVKQQNAALREALGEAEWCLVMLPEAMVEPQERCRRAKRLVAEAIAHNAGTNFVPITEVQPLIEALRIYVQEHGPADCANCNERMTAALEYAEKRGWCK